ncbi:putative protein kinase RLK-Pelle-DLSV family [Rosa chinensis]|uniref:non-specific serine/threonine protein kinase n=1 Tax=Rosa chinensis TaxID=74649 RepID=A0A2P6Q8U4_ROSCH|nr:putative protein kinase RLK-Pelle-DLSV family [Rosa chinensis]
MLATAEASTSTFQSIKDGETIVSTDGTFELGFFTPAGASGNRYVGIWYKKISVTTVVGYAEQVLRAGSDIRFRTGPWNGIRFSGTPHLGPNHVYTYQLVFDDRDHEEYYSYKLLNSSVLSRLVLTQDGLLQRYTWIDRTQSWFLYLTAQMDNCDNYALCGAYGACNIGNSPVYDCLKGFVPKFPKDWDTMDWSNGCVRKTPLDCNGKNFLMYSEVKFPNTEQSWFNKSMSLKECEMECTRNCSCTAYSNLYISEGGTGCLMWFGDLIDMRNLTENGQDIYIRMAASEQGKLRQSKKENLELPLFDLATIVYANCNFSNDNKLGEGGFGCVFKGMLRNGQEIAVKRLSKHSTQGVDEFKNEVTHIAKLQHRNLVKLLGCCIQADEMMLIYDCMPNKSLDFFIFDERKSMLLDWPKRFGIINGIARGLLYLHQDSRLRIIHRDLKAGTILLHNEFNPKILDFGLARSFGGNETVAETVRVVGTYGYMSPEYASDRLYSTKSDIFSFGVSVLEIISGKRNRGFSHPDHDLNLLGHAWNLYTEGRCIELLDTSVGDSTNPSEEVLRSIHVGLLCVQKDPKDRPSMSDVVLMLSGEGALPQPEKPGFYCISSDRSENQVDPLSRACSANEVSFTLLEAR